MKKSKFYLLVFIYKIVKKIEAIMINIQHFLANLMKGEL
jgi:hypothetical protein